MRPLIAPDHTGEAVLWDATDPDRPVRLLSERAAPEVFALLRELLDDAKATGPARLTEQERLLWEHRDVLTCYDHPEDYCCPCGAHKVGSHRRHLARIIAQREAAAVAGLVAKIQALADLFDPEHDGHDATHGHPDCEGCIHADLRALLDAPTEGDDQ